MKAKFLGAFLLLTTLLIIVSCNKQDWKLSGNIPINSKVAEVKKWFESTKITKENSVLTQSYASVSKKSSERVFARFNKINAAASWTEAQFAKHNENEFIIVPLVKKENPFKNRAYDATKLLVFYTENNIQQLSIVEIIGAKGKKLPKSVIDFVKKSFILHKYKTGTKSSSSIDASIIFYTENYDYQASFESKNGLLKPSKFQLINQKKNAQSLATIAVNSTLKQKVTCNFSCDTYFLIGITYDVNTGEILNTEILDTWSECTGDPYGGGAGQLSCITNCATQMAEGETAAEDEYAGEPVEISATKRAIAKKWKIHKSFLWHLVSRENGVVKLVNPATDRWEWESLTHHSVTKLGLSIGGSVSVASSQGTPSFVAGNPNVLIASMLVDYDVTYTPICDCLGGIIPPYTLTYSNNSPQWSAKP